MQSQELEKKIKILQNQWNIWQVKDFNMMTWQYIQYNHQVKKKPQRGTIKNLSTSFVQFPSISSTIISFNLRQKHIGPVKFSY